MVRARRALRNRNRNIGRMKRALERDESGMKIIPPTDPPQYTELPWWPFTLAVGGSSDGKTNDKITFKSLQQSLIAHIFPSGTTAAKAFEIKVRTIRVWGLDKQLIQLTPYEIVGAGSHSLSVLRDYGGQMAFSRVGWKYGTGAHIDPMVDEETLIATVTTNGKYLIYVQVLLRVLQAPVVATSATSSIMSMLF